MSLSNYYPTDEASHSLILLSEFQVERDDEPALWNVDGELGKWLSRKIFESGRNLLSTHKAEVGLNNGFT